MAVIIDFSQHRPCGLGRQDWLRRRLTVAEAAYANTRQVRERRVIALGGDSVRHEGIARQRDGTIKPCAHLIMKTLFAACACVLALTATRAESQTTASSRFGDATRLTADPTGLLRDTSVRAAPDYPVDLVRHNVTGAPVVAFVIDTTGRVETRTASFLNRPRKEFASAVCDLLPRLRFQPFRVGDQKWRVLLVRVYIFNTWAEPDTAASRAASSLARQSQEEFATKPIEQVIPQLDSLPHCDDR